MHGDDTHPRNERQLDAGHDTSPRQDTDGRRRFDSALVIGATGFVGRHTVTELLDHGYDVTALHRGERGFDFDPGRDAERRLML